MMKKSLAFAAFAAFAAVGLMAMSTQAHAFATTACESCHNLDTVKVGPSFQTVVKTYGSEKALAKVFKSGFAVKDRKVAATNAAWKAKAVVMSVQYRIHIKGHEKAAAHAIFETVKNKTFGDY